MKNKIENLLALKPESKEIFERIFEILEYELTLHPKIKEINPQLEKQKVIIVRDKIMETETIFNLARKKRHQPQKNQSFTDSYDPFCDDQRNTLPDETGGLENESAKIVANISKMAPFHSVLYFKKHDFGDLTSKDFIQALNLSKEWFLIIKQKYQTETHLLIWNFNYRAGATIYHPHFQLLSYFHTPFKLLDLYQKNSHYFKTYGRSYFDDYLSLMVNLGLGQKFNESYLYFPLTPLRNYAFNFWGEINDQNGNLLWQMIKILEKDFGLESFNFLYIFENPYLSKLGFFVDRGTLTQLSSDFGTLEVFLHPVVSFDPFETAEIVFSKLKSE